MYRLGLRLALKSGKEALIRLLLTTVAVSIGVAILLVVFADFHAFQATNNQPAWEATRPATGKTNDANTVLWNYSNDIFKGQTIERLDVAALGPNAPVPPGISHLPGSGQYYTSPALATLLQKTPHSELADRFPGTQIGTIGKQGLSSPDALVVFVGRPSTTLQSLSGTIRVTTIASGPQTSVWTNYFRYAFGIGALAFLFPILILIGTATRLAAARREERYAAMRLVGATPHQINVVASVDAVVGALFGTLVGIGIFSLLQPTLAHAAITGARYFAADVTPTIWGYAGVLVGVPIASVIVSLISLRRVRISPLGVSRKTTPPAPKVWRIIPIVLGISLFITGVMLTTSQAIGMPIYPGFLLVLIGLTIAGPWLTLQAARALARFTKGASPLLAARRLANDPKAAFRSVSGLILAVFLGTVVAGLLPAIEQTTATPNATTMSNVLFAGFTASPVCGNTVNCAASGGTPDSTVAQLFGFSSEVGTQIVNRLRSFSDVTVIPVYSAPAPEGLIVNGHLNPNAPPQRDINGPPPPDSVISCAELAKLPALGACAPGLTAIAVDTQNFTNDNPRYKTAAIADQHSPAFSGDLSKLYLRSVLVKVSNPATLEKIRTYLATQTPLGAAGTAPKTFGEAVQARMQLVDIVQRIFYTAIALTLFVAGCSLAVTVGGSMVERKRPFSLLRLSGVPLSVLYRVVLLEAILPLVTATIVAAGTGYGIALVTVKKMSAKGTPAPTLGHTYFLLIGAGLAISVIVILVTLPLLGRITQPDDARFE